MTERIYERFLLFMNAVDDDLLEEALTVSKRKRAVLWKSLTAAAACLCLVLGVLFWQGRFPAAPEERALRSASQLQRSPHRPGGI